MPIHLVGYVKPTVLLTRRHLNTMLLTNFENANSISNIFQVTHDFLVLVDPLIICIYLRITDRHFCNQQNVHHPTSKLLNCGIVQTLSTFRNPSLPSFAARKASLFNISVRKSFFLVEIVNLLFDKISSHFFIVPNFS